MKYALAVLSLVCAASASAAPSVQTMYGCVDANGVETLTNVPSPGATFNALYTVEVADTPPAPAATPRTTEPVATVARSSTTTARAAQSDADASDDTRPSLSAHDKEAIAKGRRAQVLSDTADALARGETAEGNRATARRYLKIDRGTFLKNNGVPQR
jgi:hypothetical protein